jgi:hypothetical protein
MNRSREFGEIETLYEGLDHMKEAHKAAEALEHEKNVKEGEIMPKSGPEAAVGFEEEIADPKNVKREENDHLNLNKLSDPSNKVSKESINNSDMSNKATRSEFDKLYEFAMEGEDDLGELEMGAMGGDDEMGDDGLGDELGGDEVTLTLSRDLATELHEVLMDVLGDEGLGDEFGDEGEDDLEGDFDAMTNDSVQHEKVVSEPEPRPLGGHGDRQHGDAGKGPWSKRSSGAHSGSGGKAETGKVKEEPEPKVLGGHGDRSHKDAGNTSSGSNKVKAAKKNNPGAHMLGS